MIVSGSILMTSASQVYPLAERDRVVGTDSSSDASSSEVDVVVRFRLLELALLGEAADFEVFFLVAAAVVAFESGRDPPLMAFWEVEAGLSDCLPAGAFLGEAATVLLLFLPAVDFLALDELGVSSSATSSESDGLLFNSSFSSSLPSDSGWSLLLRRAGASFSSVSV